MHRRLLLGLLVAAPMCVAPIRSAVAQATNYVPPDARVYDDIARLAAGGFIDTVITATRPYTRREIVRLLREAHRNLARRADTDWAQTAIASDLARYDRPDDRPVDYVRGEALEMDSPSRPIEHSGAGNIDAFVNPLAADRDGRPFVNGATGTLETMTNVALGRRFAVTVNPLVWAGAPRGGASTTGGVRLQSGEINFLNGNLHVDAGRGYAIFSESPEGGLLMSRNAPALDMVRIANDQPARLPFPLNFFGPMRGMLFVADMGAHSNFPHSQLLAMHLNSLPTRWFEFGIEEIDEIGGRGGPAGSLGDRILDFLIVPDAIKRGHGFTFSNKMFGGDFKLRVPALDGLEVYAEGVLDDYDTADFLADAGGIAGVSMSCLLECGRLVARAEFHQTGIRFYTHGIYTSGIQVDSLFLGDPLGPRGLGGNASLDLDAGAAGAFSLTAALDVRSGNLYEAVQSDQTGKNFHFVQTTHRPAEKRARLVGTWRSPRDSRADLRVSAGVEGVHNDAFVAGATRLNGLGQIALEYWP